MSFPFKDAAELLDRLLANGFSAYAVGGAVRDFLLGRPFHDVDIATSAPPEKVIALFSRTIPIGLQHGTVAVLYKGKSFEITTFRSERDYEDYRHPNQVTFEQNLEADLQRRDFTMNALAMDRNGKIIDLFGGQQDLQAKRIRMVGRAEERISEDPLRILRGIRFASELGFSLGEAEQSAFCQKAELLQKLSMERIDQELTKLLAGPFVNQALELLQSTGCTDQLPYLGGCERLFSQLDFSILQSDEERWAAFLAVCGIDQINDFAKKWKWSRQRQKIIQRYLDVLDRHRMDDWSRWLVYQATDWVAFAATRIRVAIGDVSPEIGRQQFRRIADLWRQCPIHSRQEMAVDGRDLLRWSSSGKRGPWVAQVLTRLEREVVDGRLPNEGSEMKAWFRKQQTEQKQQF